MAPKSYTCLRHVCGNLHEVVTEFLSSDGAIKDGKEYPAVSCGKHTAAEVKAAYEATYR